MKILVIAAHPDDEDLGCGGTIARLAKEGHQICIAILGEGITARYPEREDADRSLVKKIQNQSRQVAQILGAKEVLVDNLPDNRFDTIPLIKVIKRIEDLVDRMKPQVVYTHHGGDLNIDHVVVHRATLTATRPVQGSTVKELYAFEVLSSTEWAFNQFQTEFMPNVFVDISDTLRIKIEAMEIYKGEIRPFPYPRSPKAIEAVANSWGRVIGVNAAEAFELIRTIR